MDKENSLLNSGPTYPKLCDAMSNICKNSLIFTVEFVDAWGDQYPVFVSTTVSSLSAPGWIGLFRILVFDL